MTVGELRNKLQYFSDDTEIILTNDCIHGTAISQDFSIQTNDGDDNSPVFIEFSIKDMVTPIGEEN